MARLTRMHRFASPFRAAETGSSRPAAEGGDGQSDGLRPDTMLGLLSARALTEVNRYAREPT
jgi:hypothetical protein